MKSTLITTSVGGGLYLGYKAITTDGAVDDEKVKRGLTTSLVSTGTSAISNSALDLRSEKVHREWRERNASAYVESMSDEELAAALEKLDLLESSIVTNEDAKSL